MNRTITIDIQDKDTLGGVILAINDYLTKRNKTLSPEVAKNLDRLLAKLSDEFVSWGAT